VNKREAMARTLAKFTWSVEDPDFDVYFARAHGSWFEQVDALLAELREPDDKMKKAAWAKWKEQERKRFAATGGSGDLMHANWETAYWHAMLDAID